MYNLMYHRIIYITTEVVKARKFLVAVLALFDVILMKKLQTIVL